MREKEGSIVRIVCSNKRVKSNPPRQKDGTNARNELSAIEHASCSMFFDGLQASAFS